MSRSYPPIAAAIGVSGFVVLECTVTAAGRVFGCGVITEQPMGLAFGLGAQRLSSLFQMKPLMIDGVATGGARVRIPITFRATPPTPDAGTAPPPAALALGRRMAAALHEGDDYLAAAKQDHQRLKQVFSDTRGLSATSIKARQAALNAYERGIAPGVPAYVEARARAYARTFSEPELAQLVTFVESPIGQTWAKARLKIGEGTNFDAVHDAQRTASRAIFCKEFDCPTLDAATTSADKPPALGSRNLPEDAGP